MTRDDVRAMALSFPGTARNLLERRWRKVAPKAAVKAWDADDR